MKADNSSTSQKQYFNKVLQQTSIRTMIYQEQVLENRNVPWEIGHVLTAPSVHYRTWVWANHDCSLLM